MDAVFAEYAEAVGADIDIEDIRLRAEDLSDNATTVEGDFDVVLEPL